MKFSEQVVLGSTLIKFDSCTYLDAGCGCFIGMAGAAIGLSSFGRLPLQKVRTMFPWLTERRMVKCPFCFCRHNSYLMTVSCVAFHVESKDWTFDQALAYIRSIEPPEDDVDAPDQAVPVWNRYHGVPA